MQTYVRNIVLWLFVFAFAQCAFGQYIYWANASADTIGRANLDGSSPNQSFISGCTGPFGVAINTQYIYWTNNDTNTIGRANLDGSSANQSFISGCNGPAGVAINAQYIYWANHIGDTIGRANLDGSNASQSFISGCDMPHGVAINTQYIYWANYGNITIGRALLDGASPVQAFITGCTGPVFPALPYIPTYIELLDFHGEAKEDYVLVTWETAAELANAGFQIWRSESKDGEYAQITGLLIPSQGGSTWGARYEYLDFSIVPGKVYWYKLEDVDFHGNRTFRGPVQVQK